MGTSPAWRILPHLTVQVYAAQDPHPQHPVAAQRDLGLPHPLLAMLTRTFIVYVLTL